jgi:hypothetical protein
MLWSAFVIGPLRWYCLLLTILGRTGRTRPLYAHREVSVPALLELEDWINASAGTPGIPSRS